MQIPHCEATWWLALLGVNRPRQSNFQARPPRWYKMSDCVHACQFLCCTTSGFSFQITYTDEFHEEWTLYMLDGQSFQWVSHFIVWVSALGQSCELYLFLIKAAKNCSITIILKALKLFSNTDKKPQIGFVLFCILYCEYNMNNSSGLKTTESFWPLDP